MLKMLYILLLISLESPDAVSNNGNYQDHSYGYKYPPDPKQKCATKVDQDTSDEKSNGDFNDFSFQTKRLLLIHEYVSPLSKDFLVSGILFATGEFRTGQLGISLSLSILLLHRRCLDSSNCAHDRDLDVTCEYGLRLG